MPAAYAARPGLGAFGGRPPREDVALADGGRTARLRRGLGRRGVRRDAATVLAWIGAQTDGSTRQRACSRSRPGPGDDGDDRGNPRQPAPAAGSGWASACPGPQVSEGWHGVRFADPSAGPGEYVDVVRFAVLRREQLTYAGEHLTLPLPDGPGKPLRLRSAALRAPTCRSTWARSGRATRTRRRDRRRMARASFSAGARRGPAGRRGRPGSRRGETSTASTSRLPYRSRSPTISEPRPTRYGSYVALFVGGMGSARQNFYNRWVRELGFDHAADEVQWPLSCTSLLSWCCPAASRPRGRSGCTQGRSGSRVRSGAAAAPAPRR